MDKRIEELVEQKARHLWEFMGVADKLSTEWEQLPDDEKQIWRDEVIELIKDLAFIDREREMPKITPDKDTLLVGEEYRQGVWAGYALCKNDMKDAGFTYSVIPLALKEK